MSVVFAERMLSSAAGVGEDGGELLRRLGFSRVLGGNEGPMAAPLTDAPSRAAGSGSDAEVATFVNRGSGKGA